VAGRPGPGPGPAPHSTTASPLLGLILSACATGTPWPIGFGMAGAGHWGSGGRCLLATAAGLSPLTAGPVERTPAGAFRLEERGKVRRCFLSAPGRGSDLCVKSA
jgi:hypothetical protein